MKGVRALVLILAGLSVCSIPAQGQRSFLRRPAIGIFGGLTTPRGDLSQEIATGGHVGGLASIRLFQQLDLRVDGAWNKFASKTSKEVNATFESNARVIDATLDAVLNLGPDSSAYPGDRSVSPYLMAGGGAYDLDFGYTCTGQCDLYGLPERKTHRGFNIGFGTNATFGALHPLVEVRYHRILRGDAPGGSVSIVSVSAGIRLR